MKHRAIIFDDHELIRRTLWCLFDSRGYEVFTFPEPGMCPLNAVQKCPCPGDTNCSDLIISDINMMGANGLDFVEQLIQKGCKQRYFALMSGGFSSTDLARSTQLHCALFCKPLDMEMVTAWVEEVERSISSERILFDWA